MRLIETQAPVKRDFDAELKAIDESVARLKGGHGVLQAALLLLFPDLCGRGLK
jgi:hypothetical protein